MGVKVQNRELDKLSLSPLQQYKTRTNYILMTLCEPFKLLRSLDQQLLKIWREISISKEK